MLNLACICEERRDVNKFILPLLVIIFSIVLSGCQMVDAGVGAAASFTPVSETQFVPLTPSPFSDSVVTALPQLTPTPTLLPPTPTPTPLPLVCPYLHGRTESASFSSQAMGEKVRYLVHLPPCYDYYADKSFPVLYLFHGWPMDETHWDSMGIDELVDDWIVRNLTGPFIIVMPGVSQDGLYVDSSGGTRSFEGMIVDELVPLIDESYSTWRSPVGRALGGISRGGVWSLEIALRHQDVFGIVGAHSPALSLNKPLPQYDPFLLVKDDISGLRFYLDAGDRDWARPSTMKLRDTLMELEADVIYQEHPGAHVDTLWQAGLEDYVDYYTLKWPRSFADLLPADDGL